MMLAPAVLLLSLFPIGITPAAGKPILRVEAKRVEWGELIQGDTKKLEFVLHNDGDAPLKIVRVTPSCGCLTVDKPTESVAPGGSIRLPVTVDTGRLPGGETTKMVMLVTNDRRKGQIPLEVHGHVITLLKQLPDDLVARVFPGETPRIEATLSAATPRVAALVAARMTDPRFRATLTPTDDAGGTLVVEGPAEDGPRRLGIELEIDVRMKDNTTRTVKTTCRIEYRSRWELSAKRQLAFTRDDTKTWTDTSKPLVKTVSLIAVAPEFTVELQSVTIKGAKDGQFDCRATTVEAGKHYRIEVRLLKPVAKKFERGTLVVRTNDPKTPQLELRLRAYGS